MSDAPKAWIVRGGPTPDRIFEEYAIDNGFAIIGWNLPNLTQISPDTNEGRETLRELYEETYPEVDNRTTITKCIKQIDKFLSIREHDLIIMPMKEKIAIGIAESSYVYEDRFFDQPEVWIENDGRHRVPVRWLKTDIRKQNLGENVVSFLEKHKRQTVAEFDSASRIDLRQFLKVAKKTENVSKQYQGGLEYRRPTPQEVCHKKTTFELDPRLRIQGNKAHLEIQNELAKIVENIELKPLRPRSGDPKFDVAWRQGDTVFVAEVKSLTKDNEARQLRLGLGQVLSYAYLLTLNWPGAETVVPVLAVERRPTEEYWQNLCEELGVVLAWPGVFQKMFG